MIDKKNYLRNFAIHNELKDSAVDNRYMPIVDRRTLIHSIAITNTINLHKC